MSFIIRLMSIDRRRFLIISSNSHHVIIVESFIRYSHVVPMKQYFCHRNFMKGCLLILWMLAFYCFLLMSWKLNFPNINIFVDFLTYILLLIGLARYVPALSFLQHYFCNICTIIMNGELRCNYAWLSRSGDLILFLVMYYLL